MRYGTRAGLFARRTIDPGVTEVTASLVGWLRTAWQYVGTPQRERGRTMARMALRLSTIASVSLALLMGGSVADVIAHALAAL